MRMTLELGVQSTATLGKTWVAVALLVARLVHPGECGVGITEVAQHSGGPWF